VPLYSLPASSSPPPTPSQQIPSKSIRPQLTQSQAHSYSSTTTVPAQQLTRSNMELKAFRDLIGSTSYNLASSNISSRQITPHSESHFPPGSSLASSASNTGAVVEAAGSTRNAASKTPGAVARERNSNTGSSDPSGMIANEANDEANSLVARGYVHLGPVRAGDVDRYSDRGDQNGGSGESTSVIGSGVGFSGNGSSNGGHGNGHGSHARRPEHGRDRLASASRRGRSQRDSAFSGESSPAGGLPLGAGARQHGHHSLRRGINMGVPPMAGYGGTSGGSNDNGVTGLACGHCPHGIQVSSDSPFLPYENSGATANSNNDSSIPTCSEADADEENEGDNDNSAQDQDRNERSSSAFNYPTTTRFQHVETENGNPFFRRLCPFLFSMCYLHFPSQAR